MHMIYSEPSVEAYYLWWTKYSSILFLENQVFKNIICSEPIFASIYAYYL